jgi:hypothetical protein
LLKAPRVQIPFSEKKMHLYENKLNKLQSNGSKNSIYWQEERAAPSSGHQGKE